MLVCTTFAYQIWKPLRIIHKVYMWKNIPLMFVNLHQWYWSWYTEGAHRLHCKQEIGPFVIHGTW